MLSKINFIGIFLILCVIFLGNKIAPGRYCAYYYTDINKIENFGPTYSDENGKYGYWVQIASYPYSDTAYLEAVGYYKNNQKEGLWVDFYCDSICSKFEEKTYKNGIVVDSSKRFDHNGILIEKRWHDGKGYIIGGLSRLPDGTFAFRDLVGSFSVERAELTKKYPTDYRYVIINSCTNIIDNTVAILAAVLLIVNICFFVLKKI
ncbi:MAG: hypothetical protein IJ150_08125 [Bacteroidales bacterium]|nr:hypothetical protein [Bacteroidales bacterium]